MDTKENIHYSYKDQSLNDEECLPDLYVLGHGAPGVLPKKVCKTGAGFVAVLLTPGLTTSLDFGLEVHPQPSTPHS